MTLYNGADAAFPGQPLPTGTSIVCGYVGASDLAGQPDTPHVWTKDEWNLYLDPRSDLYGGPGIRCLPIYTHDYVGDPIVDAINAVDAVTDLGWAANRDGGRIIAWDAEALIARGYTNALNVELGLRGFRLMKYGQLSTINQNPPTSGGTWFAAWQDRKPSALPSYGVGWQWASPAQVGGFWDLSIFGQFVYDNCGQGLRRPVA